MSAAEECLEGEDELERVRKILNEGDWMEKIKTVFFCSTSSVIFKPCWNICIQLVSECP